MQDLAEVAGREYSELVKRHDEELLMMTKRMDTVAKIHSIPSKYPMVSCMSVSSWDISMFCYPDAFLSAECPELINLIEELETTLGVEATSLDLPDANSRLFNIGDVKIYATPKEDSTCQRVIVGTKKEFQRVYEEKEVEVPVYKFKC